MMIFVSSDVENVVINKKLFIDLMSVESVSEIVWNSSNIKNSFEGATIINEKERVIENEF